MSTRRYRYRRRLRRLPSIPRHPVAIARAIISPRIGLPRTRRNVGQKVRRTAKSIPSRRAHAGRRPRRSPAFHSSLPKPRRIRNRHALRRQPCIQKPNSRLAAEIRWARQGAGVPRTPVAKRNEEFRRWC